MATRDDKERKKFVLDNSGNVCVRGVYAHFYSAANSPLDDLENEKFNSSNNVRIISS